MGKIKLDSAKSEARAQYIFEELEIGELFSTPNICIKVSCGKYFDLTNCKLNVTSDIGITRVFKIDGTLYWEKE